MERCKWHFILLAGLVFLLACLAITCQQTSIPVPTYTPQTAPSSNTTPNNEPAIGGNKPSDIPRDTAPPIISEVGVMSVTHTSATVIWVTNEKSTSMAICDYGGHKPPILYDKNLVTNHILQFAGLRPGTTYRVSAISTDDNGNRTEKTNVVTFETTHATMVSDKCYKVSCCAPDFTLQDLKGQSVTLSYLGYKVVVLFLKTSDPSCMYQLRLLQENYKSLPNTELVILGIAVRENDKDISRHIDANEIPFQILPDPTGEVTDSYLPRSLPTLVLIDTEGIITARFTGVFRSKQEMLSWINSDKHIAITQTKDSPLEISRIDYFNVTKSTAEIWWTTSRLATEQVQYGVAPTCDMTTPITTGMTKIHKVTLSELDAGITYYFRVVSQDVTENRAESYILTLRTTSVNDTNRSRVWIKLGYIVGADGHPITLINNPKARDLTWKQLVEFLKVDKTDEHVYSESSFVCADFAEMLHNNAEKAGWRAAYVSIALGSSPDYPSGSGHALNAFDTTDRGLVFVDCVNGDKTVNLIIGQDYQLTSIFPNYGFYWGYMGKLLEIEATQW